MKQIIAIFLLSFLVFRQMPLLGSAQTIDCSAESAILYDVEENCVLFSKNAEKRLPMASTTKIMTAIVAIEQGDLDALVEIPPQAVGVEGSSCYFKDGEVLSLRSLLYALMLQSANDAACAIALHIGESTEGFALLMNCKAAELGLTNTHFDNPHGLDSQTHYTSAKDLAILTAYCMQNPDFCEIWSTRSIRIPLSDTEAPDHARTLYNHNRLLVSYPPCVGGKTGYTMRCGRCLVSAAEQNGHRLIAVTLNCRHDWNEHVKLFEYGFSKFKTQKDITSWKKSAYKNISPTAV